MKLTRGEEVAILIVSSIASEPDARVPLSDISREHGISLLFLKKIARLLRHSEIIDSKEGAGGGYILAKDPSAISVLDILQAVGQKDKEMISGSSRVCPLAPNCIPQKIRHLISNAFSTYCSNITIDQLIKKDA